MVVIMVREISITTFKKDVLLAAATELLFLREARSKIR